MFSADGASTLEETNVSDAPPAEQSNMKRAWPYALALAVVVTGCYLALAPLLRSLSPGPTKSTASQLTHVPTSVTVPQPASSIQVKFNGGVKGKTTFVAKMLSYSRRRRSAMSGSGDAGVRPRSTSSSRAADVGVGTGGACWCARCSSNRKRS